MVHNDGAWQPLEGVKADTTVDPLQIGLSEMQERVWKWSFASTKACGFGVKSTKATAEAMQGRWILFMGDSQPRGIFGRLATAVAPQLSAQFGAPMVNGETVTNLQEYSFLGHQDFEVVWKTDELTTR